MIVIMIKMIMMIIKIIIINILINIIMSMTKTNKFRYKDDSLSRCNI